MPVAEPKVVLILETIEERLSDLVSDEIVLPSRENYDGEDYAIPETVRDRQIVVTVGDMLRVPELDLPGNPTRECWEVEYKIRVRVMPSETDAEPIDKKLVRFVQDVRRAITGGMVYDSAWFTMNDNAIESEWGSTFAKLTSDGTSGSEGYVLPLFVRIRVLPDLL